MAARPELLSHKGGGDWEVWRLRISAVSESERLKSNDVAFLPTVRANPLVTLGSVLTSQTSTIDFSLPKRYMIRISK